jgi:DNA-binding MarR family transcriptional regulator
MYAWGVEDHRNPLNCACLNLRSATRVLTRQYDEALGSSGLLATQHSMLRFIALSEGCGAAEIADFLAMDVSTVTRNLRPLISAGYVVVGTEKSDRRRRPVRITSKGKRALESALPHWNKAQDSVVQRLGKRRYRQLLELLSELRS